MLFKEIDGCAVPAQLYDELLAIRATAREIMPGFVYNSIYRGSDKRALAILKKFHKSTQAFLYNGFLRHLPGFNPANPPGFSTHELFNDGVAYAVPRGAPLRYWMVGIDSSSAAVFCQAARKHGWIATVTYPTSAQEKQHANLRKEPKLTLFSYLKRGDNTVRVRKLRTNLALVKDAAGKPYLPSPLRIGGGSGAYFDATLYHALREYQRDHHLKDTGVYDLATHKQLQRSVRFRKQQSKKK